MPDNDIDVGLSVSLKDLKRGLKGGLSEIKGFARKAKRKLSKADVGGATRGWLGGLRKFTSTGGKVLSGFASTAGGIFTGLLGPVTSVVGGILGAFKGLLTGVIRIFKRILSFGLNAFKKLATVSAVAFAGFTAFAVRQSSKVEDQFARIATIAGKVPGQVADSLREFSVRVGEKLTKVLGGYYQVLSAGFTDTRDALRVLRPSLETALASGTNLETVVKALSRTMRNFGAETKDARLIMDQLNKVIDIGQIEMPELAAAIGPVAQAASLAGASLQETITALGLMAQQAPVAEAATQLRAFFRGIFTQSPQAQKALQELKAKGIDVTKEAFQDIGLAEYVKRLKQVPTGTLAKIFTPRRGLPGVKALMNVLDELPDRIEEVSNAGGKTASNLDIILDTFSGQLGRVWERIKRITEAFGGPIRDRLTEFLKLLPDGMKEWESSFRSAGETVAGVLDKMIEKGKETWGWFRNRDWDKILKDPISMLVQRTEEGGRKPGPLAELFVQQTESGAFTPGPIIEILIIALEKAFVFAVQQVRKILPIIKEGFIRALGVVMHLVGKKVGDALAKSGNWIANAFAPAFQAMGEAGAMMSKPAEKLKDEMVSVETRYGRLDKQQRKARQRLKTKREEAPKIAGPGLADKETAKKQWAAINTLEKEINTREQNMQALRKQYEDLRVAREGREIVSGIDIGKDLPPMKDALQEIRDILKRALPEKSQLDQFLAVAIPWAKATGKKAAQGASTVFGALGAAKGQFKEKLMALPTMQRLITQLEASAQRQDPTSRRTARAILNRLIPLVEQIGQDNRITKDEIKQLRKVSVGAMVAAQEGGGQEITVNIEGSIFEGAKWVKKVLIPEIARQVQRSPQTQTARR